MEIRIGHGYDVHRLAAGRKLILGGVDVPFARGLQGHSDADVLTHAVMDALLGAAGLGDIGQHFPDTDVSYKDASSIMLLRVVAAKLGGRVGNIDSTIVAQEPLLAPYLPQMAENIAGALGISPSAVNIKATTEEGLGMSRRGIAAHAVALIYV